MAKYRSGKLQHQRERSSTQELKQWMLDCKLALTQSEEGQQD